MSATHTESAPGCIFRGPIEAFFGTFRADFYEDVIDSITRSILEAHERMRPAGLGVGSVRIEGLTRNSRHPKSGPCDDEVGIVRVADLEGRAIALACVCCAHNTALDHRNMLVSADVGGVFCRTVERELDDGAVGLFFAGEQGDLGFRRSRFPGLDGFELAQAIGSPRSEPIALANDQLGYVLTAAEFRAGGYQPKSRSSARSSATCSARPRSAPSGASARPRGSEPPVGPQPGLTRTPMSRLAARPLRGTLL